MSINLVDFSGLPEALFTNLLRSYKSRDSGSVRHIHLAMKGRKGEENMMTWLFCGMILLAFVFGTCNGRMEAVSNAAMAQAGKAVELTLSLLGTMCLWSGVMKVAQQAGLTQKLARLLRPVTARLFDGLEPEGKAMQAISMNLTANLLGLGNAATPLGIAAMQELEKSDRTGRTASNHMVTFVVLNTASLQLLPTTTAYLRLQAGSHTPMDILPAVWIASAVSVSGAVLLSFLLRRFGTVRGEV